MKPALLVIDMQKHYVFTDEEKTKLVLQAAQFINDGIALFRKKQLPIICIQHIETECGVVPGTEGFNNIDQLQLLSSDIYTSKTYNNAFNKTNLEEILRNLGVDTVIITGYCAEYCVLSTYRGALDRDFAPILLRNAIASGSKENIRFVENINNLISLGALQTMLS
ncbi:MAG: isochorismatase hydrolase [Firmicutes bacterium]|nr:isochorismatase hydrolase [Bacillota bacterium]